MDFPFGEQITIVTRVKTGTDEYGKDVFTDETITAVGAVGPALGFESTTLGQDVTTIQPQAYFVGAEAVRVDAVLEATSALTRANGKTYEVDGEPIGMITNPFTGWAAGIAIPLKRVV